MAKLETLKNTDVATTSDMINTLNSVNVGNSMDIYSSVWTRVSRDFSNLRNLMNRVSFKNYKSHSGGIDYV